VGKTGRVSRLTIDGRPVAGNLAPLSVGSGRRFEVEAFVE
jgi:hypothetical protein